MTIFISYSHADKEFVDRLAMSLVTNRVHVWLDRWELNLGDSIIQRVQDAIVGASGLLVVLSKASVNSEWCKKELTSGLFRELDEKRVVVMPLLLDDCEVPLFLKDKLYADFRKSYEDGLRTTLEGIAKVSNPYQARDKGQKWHTDWSIDWAFQSNRLVLRLTFVEQAESQPYSCLSQVVIICSEQATELYRATSKRQSGEEARRHIISLLVDHINSIEDIKPRLEDQFEKQIEFTLAGKQKDEAYSVLITARRMGEDTGRDVLLNTSNLIRASYDHLSSVTAVPSKSA